MPAGRPKKYHSEEERKAARKAQKKAARAKRKGAKSWLGIVEKKLADVADGVIPEPKDETPPERSGEPFADLPPLDLPSSTPTAQDADKQSGSTSDSTNPSESSADATNASKPAASTPEIVFESEELQQMAEQMAYGATMALGTFAAERGYFALGEPFAKMAGQAARIIIKARAQEMGISSEEAAAWVLGGIVGVNATQAGRAWYAEYEKKKKEERMSHDAQRAAAEQRRQQNGVSPVTVAEQRKQQQEHADEARRSSGPVV